MALHGTLFLDAIGEMCLQMQALLLRFLENGEIQVPPLRERQEDVRPLVGRFIERTGRDVSTNAPRLPDRWNEVQV
jgi:transcriptional regulator with PAS, ATPase and Fis domain